MIFQAAPDFLRLDLEHRPGGVRLHLREVQLPGARRQRPVLARLQQHQRVGQLVGACRQVVGRPGDVVVVDLRLVEQPPAPALLERAARVVGLLDGWLAFRARSGWSSGWYPGFPRLLGCNP